MQPLITLRDLTRSFSQRQGLFGPRRELFAVNAVNLELFAGETLGLVGESGCGKSTLARMAVGLLSPNVGDVLFEGKSLFHPVNDGNSLSREELCRKVQMIFQDPFSSLNPRMRVGESVGEPLRCAAGLTGPERETAVVTMLERVGLAKEHMRRYPHEFSGGQRQRIAIARALVTHPSFVVCDEPTSSLDSSVQAQVLNLLAELQEQLGLAYLFISHDLAVVRHMSDRVAVMYAGLIVETAETAALFTHPRHPYTQLLLDSVPDAPGKATPLSPPTTVAKQQRNLIPDVGCPFAPRCPRQLDICARVLPKLKVVAPEPLATGADKTHEARCHNPL